MIPSIQHLRFPKIFCKPQMLWNFAQSNSQIVGNQQGKRIIFLVPYWRLAYSAYMLERLSNQTDLPSEIARRRTFAIISHPDAGKTTLTEKFLLFGGAIQMAGQVRAKGEARRTRSDFMQMEKDRGISVSASAMSFDFKEFRFNLVDTPGHSDFSEDTYRTLTAVDAAIMVIDGAKGVKAKRKSFSKSAGCAIFLF